MRKLWYKGFTLGMFICASCSKTKSIQLIPETAAPTTITGNVALLDDNDSFLADYSGTTVTVENATPVISVHPSVKGVFELPKLANAQDTTIVRFEHPGYGIVKKYFIGGTPADTSGLNVVLHPLSKVVVNHLSASVINGKLKMIFNVTAPVGSTNNYIAWVFRKNNPVISYDDAWGYRSVAVKDGDNTVSICMCPEECGYFQTGDTMYIKGFGSVSPKFDGFAYGNFITNKLILSCANTTGTCGTVALAIP